MALLRSYFEPNEEEREQGIKVPTAAHRAIAALVEHGYIRMILTTNFDWLIETALSERGIAPDIISSDGAFKGTMPYVHSKCTVVKLHGDYRDTRLKNTPAELAKYSKSFNSFFDRVLDDFGLIICGWSGAWDTALRQAILRSPNRRFATYWTTITEPNEEANHIIQQRRAEAGHIEDADQFFSDVFERVESLRELERSHPLSTAVAVSMVKRYIADHQHRIRLRDLFHEEIEKAYQRLGSDQFNTQVNNLTKEAFLQRMHRYEKAVGQLSAMMAALSYHGTGESAFILTKCIERLAQPTRRYGDRSLLDLQAYPALLLTYAGGISALTSQRFTNLAAVLTEPKVRDVQNGQKVPAVRELCVESVVDRATNWVSLQQVHEDVFRKLHHPLRDYIPDDSEYAEAFDTFEYLLSWSYRDLNEDWLPPGRFRQRCIDPLERFVEAQWDRSPMAEFVQTGLAQGADWALLKAGFFKGSTERFQQIAEGYNRWIRAVLTKRTS